MRPKVTLLARTTFVAALSPEVIQKALAKDQLQGSSGAQLIEFAGRICYDSLGKGRPSSEYHQHILESGHGSVTEHVSFTFLIEGVSRNLTHELVRHRHLSFSQRSTRYVDENESEVAWHPLFDREYESLRAQSEEVARGAYQLAAEQFTYLLEQEGIGKQTARKQARGAARGFLPSALATEIVVTGNVRAWRGVIDQRATEFADAEIRICINRVYEHLLAECPEYFSDYERYDHPDMADLGYGLRTPYRKL